MTIAARLPEAGLRDVFSSPTDRADLRSLPPRHAVESADLRVLDICEYFDAESGGVRTYLTEKARYVEASRSLRQVLLLPGARDDVRETERVRVYRLGGPRVPTQDPYRFMLSVRTIPRIVAHERPDLIEVGSPLFAPWLVRPAAKRARIPMVAFFHGSPASQLAGRSPGTARRILAGGAWRYLRALDTHFSRTIVASEFARAELAHAGIENVSLVPLGVDVQQFTPARRAHAQETRAALGLPAGPLVVYAGRFAPEKSLDVLLDAWPQVAAGTGATLVLAGRGPLRDRLRARTPRADIVWLPFVADRAALADLLALADLFVSPGAIETFGLSAAEAMACGTAVVSADEGGVGELVRRSGGGRTFPAGDARALASSIAHALDHAGQLGAIGCAHVSTHHTWPAVFARLFAVYREVLGR